MSIKYLDMFAGIGGFRSGLEKVGGFECVGYCEIDQYARRAYEAMYDTKGELYFEDATKLTPMIYPISILYAVVSHVNRLVSQDRETDLTIQEERCSLKLPELRPLKNLQFCSLKTFPDFYRMTQAERLLPSSKRWTNLGMMSHGLCLTAQISEFPNPEKECSLQDIIEKNALASYSLSAKQILKLLSGDCPDVKVIESTLLKDLESPLRVLPEVSAEKQDSM